ncbi:hypothetical protein O4H61_07230 [Roseovarius aestuarii]|nr:hypothetical protein [Roseovarius aestuarii]
MVMAISVSRPLPPVGRLLHSSRISAGKARNLAVDNQHPNTGLICELVQFQFHGAIQKLKVAQFDTFGWKVRYFHRVIPLK